MQQANINTKQQKIQEIFDIVNQNRYRFTSETIDYAVQGADLAEQEEDFVKQGIFLNYLGVFYATKGLTYKARYYFQKAFAIYQKINDESKIATSYTNIGLLYREQNKYEKALSCFFQALNFNIPSISPRILNNIGTIYIRLLDYEKAWEYLESAEQQSTEQNLEDSLCKVIINKGIISKYQENWEAAISYFNSALEISQTNQFSTIQLDCLMELASVYQATGKSDKAIGIYQKVIQLGHESELHRIECKAHFELGKILHAQKSHKKAHDKLKLVIDLTIKYEFDELKLEALELLRKVYIGLDEINDANNLAGEIIELQRKNYEEKTLQEFEDVLQNKDDEIKELAKKNQIILDQNNQLLQNYKELEQYAFIVAHDLKEPLRGISSFSQMLVEKAQKSVSSDKLESIHECRDFILNNTQLMRNKLDDLLRYSTLKPQTEKIEKIKVEQIIDELLWSYNDLITEKNAKIVVHELPELWISPQHLLLIFKELLENALKFTDSEREPIIEIGSQMIDGKKMFWISDNGIGIEKDYHKKIFRIFNRLEKQKYKGTGIGLPICEKIVNLYDGEIWVESAIDKGSKFFFIIKESK